MPMPETANAAEPKLPRVTPDAALVLPTACGANVKLVGGRTCYGPVSLKKDGNVATCICLGCERQVHLSITIEIPG